MSELNFHSPLPGLFLILSAPSGAGKTTLARRILEDRKEAVLSISYTTRAPRGRETHGVDYFFVNDEVFERMAADGAFAEHAKVHGAKYGTPRKEIEEHLDAGRIVLFDIDVQGGEQLQDSYPLAVSVLIVPPSMEALENRLRKRSTEDENAIKRRLGVAKAEMIRASKSYQYLVVNDDLETACARLRAIIDAEQSKLCRRDRIFFKNDA